MKSGIAKNSKLISIAAKRGWKNLRNNKEKYKKFCENRSRHMKSLTSKEQGRRSKKGWDKLSNKEYNKRCKINKLNWTDDLKLEKSKQMKDYFKNNPTEATRRVILQHSNKTIQEKEEFKKKMDLINKDPKKRKLASKLIKLKWKDPEFISKMKNRKSPAKEYMLISPTGEVFYRFGLRKFIEEFNFNETLVRKFINTKLKVKKETTKKLNKKTISTLDWEFNNI